MFPDNARSDWLPWPNGVASRSKLKSWVYSRLCLGRPCVDLVGIKLSVLAKEKLAGSFGHPTQVSQYASSTCDHLRLLAGPFYMQYSNALLLGSDPRPSQRSEPQQFRIIGHPTSDQLKACSCISEYNKFQNHCFRYSTPKEFVFITLYIISNQRTRSDWFIKTFIDNARYDWLPWSYGVASRRKLKTCVCLRLRLARPCVDLG